MGSLIYEDTLNKIGKHNAKNEWWEAHGVEVVRTRFDGRHDVPWSFGDYAADGSNIVIDTKASVAELSQNLCREHGRFKREVERANADGCLLVVLTETNEIATLEDMRTWVNSHCQNCHVFKIKHCAPFDRSEGCLRHGTRKPVQGDVLAKTIATMTNTRNIRFEFVRPSGCAERICELLGVSHE